MLKHVHRAARAEVCRRDLFVGGLRELLRFDMNCFSLYTPILAEARLANHKP